MFRGYPKFPGFSVYLSRFSFGPSENKMVLFSGKNECKLKIVCKKRKTFSKLAINISLMATFMQSLIRVKLANPLSYINGRHSTKVRHVYPQHKNQSFENAWGRIFTPPFCLMILILPKFCFRGALDVNKHIFFRGLHSEPPTSILERPMSTFSWLSIRCSQ